MASVRKKQPRNEKPREESAADYYRLKTEAVDDLVHADESNSPVVSEEELNKYRHRKLKLPMWLKVVLIKAWFYGAVCFFFLWGLGMYVADQLDLFVVTGIALGMVTDLLINTIFRYFSETEGSNDRWMMFPKKGLASFFLNIGYALLVLLLVALLYNVLNIAILSVTGQTDKVAVGVEPILFGLFFTGVDMLLIGCKRLLRRIFDDAKEKAATQKERSAK